MNTDLEAYEQWEQLKRWWKKHGKSFLLVIVLGLVAGYGWHYFQAYRMRQKARASEQFDRILSLENNPAEINTLDSIAQNLQTTYSNTVYAPLSALFQAKGAIQDNQLSKAARRLTWALAHFKDTGFKQITRLRLARVLIAEKKYKQARATLKTIDSMAFLPAILVLRANIDSKENQQETAKIAYKKALATLPDSDFKAYLKMQLYDLPSV